MKALEDLSERGKLIKAPNPVARDPNITGAFKDRLIKGIHKRFANSDPGKSKRLIERVREMHPDHIQDLQLMGADEAFNLWLLDARVNTTLGNHIWQQIRGVTDFSRVRIKFTGSRK